MGESAGKLCCLGHSRRNCISPKLGRTSSRAPSGPWHETLGCSRTRQGTDSASVRAARQARYPQLWSACVARVFSAADRDGDGRLGEGDLAGFLAADGLSPYEARPLSKQPHVPQGLHFMQ